MTTPILSKTISATDWYKAKEKWGTINKTDDDFYKFIGNDHWDFIVSNPSTRQLSVDAFNKIEALNSPHAYALLMAYKARKRWPWQK